MPSRFTPQHISKLAILIEPSFTIETLGRAVQTSLRVTLASYSIAGSLPAVILELCNKVNEQGDISTLVDGLKSVNPDPSLHQALDAFLRPEVTAAEACGVLLVRTLPPLALINRQTLRSYLGQITAPGSGYRAISVTGPAASGKSYSKELIRYVAESSGFQHVQIDVVDETRSRTLREVLEKVTLGLRRPFKDLTDLLPDQPTDAQAADRFVAWLGGISQDFVRKGEHYWLTFDGLDRPGAGPTRDNLIPVLLKAVTDNTLCNIRLFLLGDNGKRVRAARLLVLHEEAQSLTLDEIKLFLERYAEQLGCKIKDEDLAQLVKRIVGDAQWPFDHEAMEKISETVVPMIDRVTGTSP